MSYIINTICRFCDNSLIDVIKLGDNFPLAGGFMRNESEFNSEKLYPLNLGFCDKCILLQCKEVIASDILFKNGYFYYSSMIPMLKNHFEDYSYKIKSMYSNPEEIKIIEIGCNDGVFLRPLRERGFNVIGVDPSNTVNKCINDGFKIYNTYFDESLAEVIESENGKCDVFLSSNSFAHINNMKSIMNGIKKILKLNGLAIIEVHYSKTIIDELQFDFIYHEHMSYYNITSFLQIANLYDMSLENVELTKIHGSSIRVYLRNTKNLELPNNVKNLIENEKHLCDVNIYNKFNTTLLEWKKDMLYTLSKYNGKKIYGYGSSGRSNIILRYLDINLDAIIDDAPSKIGSYTPVYHLKIKSTQEIIDNPPDVIIILAWAYKDYIISKLNNIYKGIYIVPLPYINVINSDTN